MSTSSKKSGVARRGNRRIGAIVGVAFAVGLKGTSALSVPALADSGRVDSGVSQTVRPAVLWEGATELPLGFAFNIAGGSSYTISFDVPNGMVPTAFRGALEGTKDTKLRVTTPTRAITVLDTTSPIFEFPLEPGDVDASGKVALTFSLPPGTWCDIDGRGDGFGYTVTVSDAVLGVTGEMSLPTTVADFFDPGALEVTVDIPAGTEDVLGAAGLAMVAGTTVASGGSPANLTVGGTAPQPVSDTAKDVVPTFAQRRVVLAEGSDPVTTEISRGSDSVPTLTMTGTPEGLESAARTFGQEGIALASAANTEGLAFTPGDLDPRPTALTLAELGSDSVSLQGYGQQDAFMSITQGSFNRPVGSLTVNLQGAISSTEQTIGTVEFLWNNVLVDSFKLDHEAPTFNRTIEIDHAQLRSGNYLVMRLQAVTANNKCIDQSLLPPVRVDIETDQSTVTVTEQNRWESSFQVFPQVFTDEMRIAFGGVPTSAQLSATGDLVAALQRGTPRPLLTTVVSADEILAGGNPGIFVAPTEEQSDRLGLPLFMSDPRLLNDQMGEVTVGVDQPYAALQSVKYKGRPMLVLGNHAANEAAGTDAELMTVVSGLSGAGWWQQEGDLRIATMGNLPVLLDTGLNQPAESEPVIKNPLLVGGIVLGIIGLLAVTFFLVSRRPKGSRVAAH